MMATRKSAKKATAKPARKPGTAVAAYKPPPLPADAPPAAVMLHAIMGFARDKSVSVDKFERALAIQERLVANEAKREFDIAFADMAPDLPVISKRGKITIRDKNDKTRVIQSTPYALFEDIQAAVKPVLARCGFNIRFRTSTTEGGMRKVTAILGHKAGHREESEVDMPPDPSGSKNSAQAVTSAISYGKRVAMTAILNLQFEGEDDDGQAAGGTPEPGTISADQLKQLQTAMAAGKHPLSRVLNYVNTAANLQCKMLQDIPADWFDRTITAMKAAT